MVIVNKKSFSIVVNIRMLTITQLFANNYRMVNLHSYGNVIDGVNVYITMENDNFR